MRKQKVNIVGTEIDNLSFDEVLGKIEDFISERLPHFVITSNVDHLMVKQKDCAFEEAYKKADLVVPDGVPLLWASKFFGTPLKGRVDGTDLLEKISELSSKKGYAIFLLGAEKGVAEKTSIVLKERYPELKIAGTYFPCLGFEKDDEENEKIAHLIRSGNANILFTALGSPKGEKWICEHYRSIGIPVSVNVGSSFDFISGRIKRAPVWMQRHGLEWFWRLLMEPRRLWKRYLIRDIGFFYLVFKQKYLGRS